MNLLRRSRPLSAVATAPLVGMCGCLVLAAAPLFPKVAGWAGVLLLLSGAARLYMNRRAARLPSLPLKVALFGLGAGGIAITYGSMVGIEPGLSILLVLVALKLIETNGERDFQVLALLGYFLALCTLFFSQDLLLWLYVGAVFVLITAMLVRFHRGPGAGTLRRSVLLSGTMLLQAVPIIALLFVFFPRTSLFLRFPFGASLLGARGMSDRLSPGSVSALAMNEEIAFRADFPDGNAPPISQMYWRGLVLWRGAGLTWVNRPPLPLERRLGQLAGPAIRQRISLQPHGGRWIFALDRPMGDHPKFNFMPGGYFERSKPVLTTFHYEVVSQPENRETTLLADQQQAALAPATNPSPKVQALVKSWTTGAANEREVVERALRHFHEEKFSYSLQPGTYGANALDEFLFERRTGFCEHYAAAFATLMRVAGIPSRVVLGYHGGELNGLGNYVIIRQSDAHAWAEVWIKDTGWLRVDPTEVIAPDRISSGLASFLQTRADGADNAAGANSEAALGLREMMRELRMAWDSINYQWDLRVLNFDEDNQRSFLATIGFGDERWLEALAWAAAGIALALIGIALWLRRSGRPRLDEASRWWERFCGTLAAAGVRRETWEGPVRFGERAAAEVGEHRAEILRVAEVYARLRYAPEPPPVQELAAAVRGLPPLRTRR
ncbi:MAG: protein-glutamine gamma-glutamyltransferase [Chthoniobacter sp.]|jgi:transglutaminase-like putative cysteine protease|nr:protein-glutamine gamma-glutamyltransferase [Chthoniobacter sp.]